MPIPENSYRWDLGSTGAAAVAVPCETAYNITLFCRAGGSTVTLGIEAGGTSTSPFARMGSSAYSLAANEEVVIQLDGPLSLVRPYLITGSTCTVRLVTN